MFFDQKKHFFVKNGAFFRGNLRLFLSILYDPSVGGWISNFCKIKAVTSMHWYGGISQNEATFTCIHVVLSSKSLILTFD